MHLPLTQAKLQHMHHQQANSGKDLSEGQLGLLSSASYIDAEHHDVTITLCMLSLAELFDVSCCAKPTFRYSQSMLPLAGAGQLGLQGAHRL